MKKVLSIILLVVAIVTMALGILDTNAELWGIKPEIIAVISSVILAIKEFVQNLQMLTAEQTAEFANDSKLQYKSKSATHSYTAADVRAWKNSL